MVDTNASKVREKSGEQSSCQRAERDEGTA